MKNYVFMMIFGLFCFCLAASAQAHMLWLIPDKPAPDPGETVTLTIGFGHHFPGDKMEKEGRLKRVYAVAPDGSELACQALSPCTYTFTPQQEGTYWLFAALKSGFVSNTTSGRKLGNKQTLENVVSCSAFRMSGMTSIRCGKGEWEQAGGGAFDLELVPVADPAGKKKDDTIALKVMFQGEPLAGASVTPAAAKSDHHHDSPAAVETNAEGRARVKRTGSGPWMFTARHDSPYPKKDLCDSYFYCTTLTLGF